MAIPYEREAAVSYAEKWALRRNPKYLDFSALGGDCTNFVSQCLYAGKMPMNYMHTFGWYYRSGNAKAPAWSGAAQLYNFLTQKNVRPGPFALECTPEEVMPGDILQLSFDGNIFSHSLLAVESSPSAIYVAAHSDDAWHRNLDEYLYVKIRALHILGAH